MFGDDKVWYCSYCHNMQPDISKEKAQKQCIAWMDSIAMNQTDQNMILRCNTQLCVFVSISLYATFFLFVCAFVC